VVVNITASPMQVVQFTYIKGADYTRVGENIEANVRDYELRPGELFVEANGPGGPVIDHLKVPSAVANAARFNTTKPSKQALLNNLVLCMEKGTLQYDRVQMPQLDRDLRASQWEGHTPDSTMALGIALHDTQGICRRDRGRMRKIQYWGGGAPAGPGGNRHPLTPAHWG
jgi:hypothetical protein